MLSLRIIIVIRVAALCLFTMVLPCFAVGSDQNPQSSDQPMPNMPSMSAPVPGSMNIQAHTFIDFLEMHATSGTDAEPISTPFAMMMKTKGKWTLMLHGIAFLNDIQQSGRRGGGYSGEGERRFRREAERRSGAKVNSSRSEATLA